MYFLFLTLISASIFADSDKPIMICREDKYDLCRCEVKQDECGIQYLLINCYEWKKLTTTNVVLPRRVFNTYDIEYITIFFDYNQIQRIPSPAISSQLAPKLRHMRIRCYNSCSNLKIDSKAFDNLHMLETLNITGCGVTDDIIKSGWLTAKLGETLLSLSLQSNSINQVLRELSQLKNLISLNLAKNKLYNIPDNAFYGLANLSKLNLAYTHLIDIPTNALSKIPNLINLRLSGNLFNEVSFNGLENLVWLYLDSTNLTEIPSIALNRLVQLEYLNLGDNLIRKISKNAFSSLRTLKSLDLAGCIINRMSNEAFYGLSNLSELNLNSNMLKTIPSASFPYIPNLIELRLSGNSINRIAANSFKSLDKLISLDISKNPDLQEIDQDGFFRLTQLKDINLSKAKLKEIPIAALQMLPNIESIDLNQNYIKKIPKEHLQMISQIHVLKLNFNQIKRIESYAFAGLGNLTSLGLGSQSLFYIETNAFDGLTELRHLDLSQSVNLIFADNAFGRYSLENLDTLDLSYCNLSTLPDRLFQALPNLWYLYLSVNMFTSIPTTIRNIRQLYLLDLSHNPIRQIESHTFNNSKIKYLDLDLIQALTKIDNCAFCGLTVWSLSLTRATNLTFIHKNAFGLADNSTDKTRKIRQIKITYTSLETLDKNLLSWKTLDLIDIRDNPANCNPAMDWLFRDPDLKWNTGREDRCYEDWCEYFQFNETCQSTTYSPISNRPIHEHFTTETSSGIRVAISSLLLISVCLINIIT